MSVTNSSQYSIQSSENSDKESYKEKKNQSKQDLAAKLFFHRHMNELQRLKEKKKYKKCFEILRLIILECL